MLEVASTTRWPWSGYWWPQHDAAGPNLYEFGGPLNKYDWYVYNTRGYNPDARGWEYQNHQVTDRQYDWAGHCNAWSAASMMVADPPASGVQRGGVYFTQDDLEGLVTEVWDDPSFTWLAGTRSETDAVGSAEYQDMDPAWMDYLLRYYVGQYRYPFIMDTSAGSQVWNFPVFAYQRNTQSYSDGSLGVHTTVWFSDASAGAATTQYFARSYDYQLWNTGGGSTGRWLGDSHADHPDFAWVPTGRGQPGNPNLDSSIVSEILGYAV